MQIVNEFENVLFTTETRRTVDTARWVFCREVFLVNFLEGVSSVGGELNRRPIKGLPFIVVSWTRRDVRRNYAWRKSLESRACARFAK